MQMSKKNVLRKIAGCDVLIWAFPLYVDAVPSHVLPWFYELENILMIGKDLSRGFTPWLIAAFMKRTKMRLC